MHHVLLASLILAALVQGPANGQAQSPPRMSAEESPAAAPPGVTERLAHPYSIDLLPDDPVPPPFEATPEGSSRPPQQPSAAFGQKTVTGDLFDRWLSTKDSGITFGGRVTQFAFGVDGGIDRPVPYPLGPGDVFRYTGRSEYDAVFDLEKFGGLPHCRLLVRAEQWYGEFGNVSLRTGAFTPAVFPTLLPPRPNGPGVPYITNVLFTQPLSPNWVVFGGKKDVLGSFDQDIFAGGDGTDQFVNQALIANPQFLLGMPYSFFTTGFVSPRDWGGVGMFVMDPKNRTADFMQFGDLFNQGIIIGGEIKVKTRFFDLPGQQHVGAVWKHQQQLDLRFAFTPPGPDSAPGSGGPRTLWDSWLMYYGFDQYFVRYTDTPDRGWGLFGRASIGDGNPNPIQYFLSTGVGGFSPLGGRRGDTFGLGWFLVGTSDQFGPVPTALFGPRQGMGLEWFYNIQATPWLNITPDLQWIRPGLGAISTDNAFIYGIRANATF
ncbi:MAG: carbohydrate porin [Planctomycetia bacterium]